MRRALILAVGIAILSATPALAYEGHYTPAQEKQCRFEGDNGYQTFEVRDTIRCAFIRVGDASQQGTALAISDRESGWVPTAYNTTGCGGYGCGGLFQHAMQYWSGRYASFPDMDNWYNLSPSVFDPRTNAFVTARMVMNGNWGPWQ